MAPKPQPFQELLKLDKMVRAANLGVAAQGQQAMAQAQQQQPTVKDQLMMALNQAIGASNYGFADGGIVAFAGGGDINPKTQEQQDREKIISALNAAGFSAQKLAAAGFDIISMPARALMGVYNSLVRGPRAFGLNLPFIGEDSPEFISSMTPAMDAVRRAEDAKKYTEYMDPNRPPTFGAPASPAPLRGAPTPPRPAPAGAGVSPRAAPAPAPAPAAPAPAGADVVASPAAGRIDLAELRKTQEALAELAGQRGAVSPAVAAAREELDRLSRTALDPAEQQLRELEAQQQRGIFSDPEALAAMLSGMRGDMRLGEALAAAGAGAAKTRAGRETRVREAQGRLNQLRSDLALAQAKERLARVEGDERAAREAQMQQAEIRSRIAATTVDMQFKQENLEVEREKAAAQTRTSRAAEESVRNRPTTEDRGETAKRKAISDAIEAAQKAVPVPAGVTGPARQRMIDRQVEMVAQQVAPYGVTRDEVLRYFATPGPASGATTSTQGWGQPQVVPKP
jgi:hypothetical protein